MKKILSISLTLCILCSSLVLPTKPVLAESYQGENLQAPRKITSSEYQYDCVWFGQYPQDEVTSEALIAELKQTDGTSDDYIYYDNKCYTSLSVKNEAGNMEEHYFVCQPLKWRILSVEEGSVRLLSDSIIDYHTYEEVCKSSDIETTNYYNKSWNLREVGRWLNDEFFNLAFNEDEAEYIINDYTKTEKNSKLDTTYMDAVEVNLLTTQEVCMEQYGFLSETTYDNSKLSEATDYAKLKGASTGRWMIKNIGQCVAEGILCQVGLVDAIGYELNYSNGIRPVITVAINPDTLRYAGTVSTNGDMNEQNSAISYYIKGDVTGDGYIGTEDAFYTTLACFKLLIPKDAVLPTVVQYNREATDINGDGETTLADAGEMMKAVAGNNQLGNGRHKITSSDKSEVTYKYDGEFVIASVSVKELSDTAIVYDKTKVEYVGRVDNFSDLENFTVVGSAYNNEEQGLVDVVAVCVDAYDEPDNARFGTIDLKFVVKDSSKEVIFGSCTGAGYIQDNLAEGESFKEAAKRYEEALYTEDTVKIVPISSGNEQQGVAGAKIMPGSLTDAQQVLKIALKIENAKEDSNLVTDMNNDGQVTLEDAKLALQLALKIISVDELAK